uniref:Uncharacterized protein n=1 Tax=Oryza punctata TaxID=4537 RepID=A0A0E0MNH5_ORYPU
MDGHKRRRGLSLAAGNGTAAAAPPAKRQRPAAAAAEVVELPSPRRGLLRQSVLVVVFLRRAMLLAWGRNDDDGGLAAVGVSRIGCVVRDELRRCLGPIVRGFSLQFRQETNNEGANAEGVGTNEGDNKSTSVRLRFLNEMKPPVYHDDELKAEYKKAIRIGIFKGEQMIKSGPLSNVNLEILALEGNFPYGSMDSWTSEEFNEHRACGRDERGDVLAGERTVQLINGEASLGAIKFREGSCKANEKSHPPKLDDKVHRLEEIAINGKYCKRLAENGIKTVKDFLKDLNKDPDNLANILNMKKGSKAWEKMVTHARDCSLEGKPELKSYPDARTNVVLFFDCVNSLIGAWFGDSYIASDMLNSAQQVFYPGGAEVNCSHQTNCGVPCDYSFQGASMAPGFDQLELRRRHFLGRDDMEASTSAHNNLPFPPQQQRLHSVVIQDHRLR